MLLTRGGARQATVRFRRVVAAGRYGRVPTYLAMAVPLTPSPVTAAVAVGWGGVGWEKLCLRGVHRYSQYRESVTTTVQSPPSPSPVTSTTSTRTHRVHIVSSRPSTVSPARTLHADRHMLCVYGTFIRRAEWKRR